MDSKKLQTILELPSSQFKLPEGSNWAQIDSFPEYFVSDQGEVYSTKRNRILKQGISSNGYLTVALMGADKKSHSQTVHSLVANAFVPKPQSDEPLEVNHIDENKHNNAASNLEWVTHLANVRHGTGITRSGKQVVLTKELEVRYFSTMTEAAKWLQVGVNQISSAAKRGGRCHGYKVDIIS